MEKEKSRNESYENFLLSDNIPSINWNFVKKKLNKKIVKFNCMKRILNNGLEWKYLNKAVTKIFYFFEPNPWNAYFTEMMMLAS